MGKTHLDTLMTITNIATLYTEGLKDFPKEEEMCRLAPDGYERLLVKDADEPKGCARKMVRLHVIDQQDKDKATAMVKAYPFLMADPVTGPHVRKLLR